MPKQMVAGAAYDALMKFDEQLQLGMTQHLQHVNYVNNDADTTAVFIQTFSQSASRDQTKDRDRRTVTGEAAEQAVCRSKSTPSQPVKQSMWHDDDVTAATTAGRRRRRHRDDVRLPASSAAEPPSDIAPSPGRTHHESSNADSGYECSLVSIGYLTNCEFANAMLPYYEWNDVVRSRVFCHI